MKFASVVLFLTVAALVSARTLTKTVPAGANFVGSTADGGLTGTGLYRVTVTGTGTKTFQAYCFPSGTEAQALAVGGLPGLGGASPFSDYYRCEPTNPNLGVAVESTAQATVLISEVVGQVITNGIFQNGPNVSGIAFQYSGFIYNTYTENANAIKSNGSLFTDFLPQQATAGLMGVVVAPYVQINVTQYNTPLLTSGQTFSVNASNQYVCGQSTDSFASGYEFITTNADAFQTAQLSSNPNAFCRTFSGSAVTPNNVTFNSVAVTALTTSPQTKNCSIAGRQYWYSAPAPSNNAPGYPIFSYSAETAFATWTTTATGVPSEWCSQLLGLTSENVTKFYANPTVLSSVTLQQVVSQSVANVSVPSRGAVVVPLTAASTRDALLTSNATGLQIGSYDSYGIDNGRVFLNQAGGYYFIANSGDAAVPVEVTATRVYFPVVTPGVSGVSLNATATNGPLLFLTGTAPVVTCVNITTGSTAATAATDFDSILRNTLFFLPQGSSYLSCRTSGSADGYKGINAESSTDTLAVTAYNPPNATYGTQYNLAQGSDSFLYNFGAAPSNKNYVVIVRSSETVSIYSNQFTSSGSNTNGGAAYVALPAGRADPFTYLGLTQNAGAASTFTVFNVEATPSCDADNACSSRSTCTNGVCSSDCTGGFSGYGCTVAPDATTAPATQAPNGGTGNRPNSASSVVASIAVVLAVVALLF